jgi:uncharacterized protein YukE
MGFEPPPGDPDALDAALTRLSVVGTDLHTKQGTVRSGFADALASWHGARADVFRAGSAGIQLQVSEAADALDHVVAEVKAYSSALRSTIEQIDELRRTAERRTAAADAFAQSHPGGDLAVDLEYQHAARLVSSLQAQAEDLRAALRSKAAATAGLVDSGTTLAVPDSATLSPAEIARRVHSTTGVTGIQQAITDGTLTADQAWGALASPSTEVPADAVNADGSIKADVLAEDVKEEAENPAKKTIDTTLDYWTLTISGPGAWSVARLARAYTDFARAESALPPDLFKLSAAELDAIPKGPAESPLAVLDQIERSTRFTAADAEAFDTFGRLRGAEEAIGGLGRFEALGRVFDGVAVVGDIWTLSDPKSPVDDKVDAGVNLVGLGMTTEVGADLLAGGLEASGLVAADAALGWIPVVGWGLVAVTAGYEVYKHWDEITKLTGEASHAVENFVTDTAPHALSSAAHSVGNFVSDHVPHIHLW